MGYDELSKYNRPTLPKIARVGPETYNWVMELNGFNPRRDPGGVILNWARSILRMFIDIPRQKNIPDFDNYV